jgi:hypothetical protein
MRIPVAGRFIACSAPLRHPAEGVQRLPVRTGLRGPGRCAHQWSPSGRIRLHRVSARPAPRSPAAWRRRSARRASRRALGAGRVPRQRRCFSMNGRGSARIPCTRRRRGSGLTGKGSTEPGKSQEGRRRGHVPVVDRGTEPSDHLDVVCDQRAPPHLGTFQPAPHTPSAADPVPRQATFALLVCSARGMTLRTVGSVRVPVPPGDVAADHAGLVSVVGVISAGECECRRTTSRVAPRTT